MHSATAPYYGSAGHARSGSGVNEHVAGAHMGKVRLGGNTAPFPYRKAGRLKPEWVTENINVHTDPNGEVCLRSEGVDRIQIDGGLVIESRQRDRHDIAAASAPVVDVPEGVAVSVPDANVAGLLPEVLDCRIEVSPEHIRSDLRYLLFSLCVLTRNDMPVRDEVMDLAPFP